MAPYKHVSLTDKECPTCRQIKPVAEFHKNRNRSSGVASTCKTCCNARTLRWRASNPDKLQVQRQKAPIYKVQSLYNVTSAQIDEMLAAQNRTCKICGGDNGPAKRLAVDHCHTTGKVRGLLCDRCNHGLGHFRDNPGTLSAAIAYLFESEREG